MKRKKDLFRLIKAMSRSEKRYFTLDAQKSGRKDTKYLELFHTISKMDEYDDALLKEKFPKNLSTDKGYLYDAILRSMRDYRSAKSRAARIKEKLLDAKYLYERGLYDLCEESLAEAKQIAEELGDHLMLLEINKELRRLYRETKRREYVAQIEDFTQDKEWSIRAIKEEFEYLDLYDRLFKEITQRSVLTTAEEKENLRKQYAVLDQRLDDSTISIRAARRLLQCKAIFYQLLGDYDKVFENYFKVVDWWDSNELYKREEFYRYIIDISNLLSAAYYNERYNYIGNLVQKLEAEPQPSSFHEQKVLFQKKIMFKLVYHINLGVTEKLDQVSEEISYGLKQYKLNPSSEKVIAFNLAVLLFTAAEHRICIQWCNDIIYNMKAATRQDITRAAHLLKVVIAHEMDDLEFFDSTFRSSQRFFGKHKNDPSYPLALGIMNKIRQLSNSPIDSYKAILQELKTYIVDHRSAQQSKGLLGLDELILLWVEGKQQQRSTASLLKAKNAKAV